MKILDQIKNNQLFIVGILSNIASFLLLLLISNNIEYSSRDLFDEGGLFFINYLIALIYAFIVLINSFKINKWKIFKIDLAQLGCMITLFSISCFSLNIAIPIFADLTGWLIAYLIIMHLPLLAIPIITFLPSFFKHIAFFINGIGSIMALYFALYLLPFAAIGIIGAIFFGISLHLFVPALLLTAYIIYTTRTVKRSSEIIAYLSGILIPVLILGMFLLKWNSTADLIHKVHANIITNPDRDLPTWVQLSKKVSNDPFTSMILKGDLTYQAPNNGRGMWDLPRSSFSEVKEHDPLVFMGLTLMEDLSIGTQDRIKILESKYNARHLAHRKLWGGKDLSTSNVLTNVQVFPEYRMAYLEKIINIKNNTASRWNSNQEALYSFHLPEGSIVTSLSLWINGVEEKSRLTTKSKADSAYVQIVGRESRDPALLHWQEGNRVTVTIFPCIPSEERTFKVGFTIPLENNGEKLVLRNVDFEGPDFSDCRETAIIDFRENFSEKIKYSPIFEEADLGKLSYTGDYTPFWEIEMPVGELSKSCFSFNDKSFHLEKLSKERAGFSAKSYYLDLNSQWTKREVEEVLKVTGETPTYVYLDKIIQVNSENKEKLVNEILSHNFSLFPIHKIEDIGSSIVITKSEDKSPNLNDLKNSQFYKDLKQFASNDPNRIRVFNLGIGLNSYLKTLKEFQFFNYEQGKIKDLKALIENKEFSSNKIKPNVIQLDNAGVAIVMDTLNKSSGAPDHLMRLFAYGKIMQKMGRAYFKDTKYVDSELINMANEAYVVSPVSSLVVLESIKDYERFDIGENKNSLKNASTKSSGAVPEPHEWALIILLLTLTGYTFYKRKFSLNKTL